MSTADPSVLVDAAVARSKAIVEAAAADEAAQLDMLGLPSPEAIADARERLGPGAGNLSVLREARQGRPKGARNKRTDDYARFLLSHGGDPGVVQVQLANTPPEVLIENSRRTVTKINKSGVAVTYEETMSYETALSLILRAAEGVQPYINSKKPVAIDATIRGVRVVEEIGGHAASDPIDGGMLRVAAPDEDLGGEGVE